MALTVTVAQKLILAQRETEIATMTINVLEALFVVLTIVDQELERWILTPVMIAASPTLSQVIA